MSDIFTEIGQNRTRGFPSGLYSVCSSNMMVLEATIRRISMNNRPVLIESTANQVNQEGGYTGMTPPDFIRKIKSLMKKYGVSEDLVIFGGDHLGPYPWKAERAEIAMHKAETMVRNYIAAGARKIHLDASMALADDTESVLAPELIAQRSARLCSAAEDEFKQQQAVNGNMHKPPVYIIGTEVPVPGGEIAGSGDVSQIEEIAPTTSESFELTYEVHRKIFMESGLLDAWTRVMAVVIQPGVDFAANTVVPFHPENMAELKKSLATKEHLFFEAHSTDYQTTEALRNLVEAGFVFLKVGPALTFTYREAVFGLAQVARVLGLSNELVNLEDFMFETMRSNPKHWSPYYEQADKSTLLYSLSDRIRYYWDIPEAQQRVADLIDKLSEYKLPIGLVSQYLPRLGGPETSANNIDALNPKDIILNSIDAELARYETAFSIHGEG